MTRSSKALVALCGLSAAVVALLPAAAGAGGVPAVVVGNDMPTWSADGSRIAFVSFRNGRVGDIFTVGADGRGERRLTATAAHDDMPRWSRDGSKIAFVRHTGGAAVNFHVFVMNADGTDARQVTQSGPANFAPTWSPDGTRLAFVTTRHGPNNPEIYAIDIDGTNEARLTNDPLRDDSPSWSPDGGTIVFESNRSPIRAIRLYAMRPDGTGVRALTDHPVNFHSEMQPSWSPDGRTIAFISDRQPPDNNTEVYFVDADGTNTRRVTRNLVRDAYPAFSPDGQRIAVARGAALRPEVYVVPRDGRSARKVTGANLRFRKFTVSPKRPKARDFFSAELTVRPTLDRYADVACYAAIGRQLIEPEVATVRRGRVHCAWYLPRTARGKRVYGFTGARAGQTQVTRSFSFRAR